MSIILLCVILVVGTWIFISPWVLGYVDTVILGLALFSGIMTIVFSAINIKLSGALLKASVGKKTSTAASGWPGQTATDTLKTIEGVETVEKLRRIPAAVGIFSLAIGIAWSPTALGWSLLGSGIVIALIGLAATQISAKPMSFNLSARDGSSLITTSEVRYEDDSIVIKGKILGSMTSNTYFTAGEMWKALSLVPPAVLLHLPIFLLRGWQANRIKKKN